MELTITPQVKRAIRIAGYIMLGISAVYTLAFTSWIVGVMTSLAGGLIFWTTMGTQMYRFKNKIELFNHIAFDEDGRELGIPSSDRINPNELDGESFTSPDKQKFIWFLWPNPRTRFIDMILARTEFPVNESGLEDWLFSNLQYSYIGMLRTYITDKVRHHGFNVRDTFAMLKSEGITASVVESYLGKPKKGKKKKEEKEPEEEPDKYDEND